MDNIILWIMAIAMVLGALDRMFGSRLGLGKQFEEGILAIGALSLSMLGILTLAPVLARLLRPVLVPVYGFLGADPAMFAGSILANDMGGAPLAMELAGARGRAARRPHRRLHARRDRRLQHPRRPRHPAAGGPARAGARRAGGPAGHCAGCVRRWIGRGLPARHARAEPRAHRAVRRAHRAGAVALGARDDPRLSVVRPGRSGRRHGRTGRRRLHGADGRDGHSRHGPVGGRRADRRGHRLCAGGRVPARLC